MSESRIRMWDHESMGISMNGCEYVRKPEEWEAFAKEILDFIEKQRKDHSADICM